MHRAFASPLAAVAGLLLALAVIAPAPTAAGGLSQHDLDLYRAAFRHAGNEQWEDAVRIAAEPEDRLPAKVIRWLDLARPRSGNSFSAITDFIRANPRWPNQNGLLRQAESTMPTDMADALVLAWFEDHPPVSAAGVTRHAEALSHGGQAGKAAELVRRFWVDANFTESDDELEFRRRFASVLRQKDHLARLDRVLWDHHTSAARRLLALVDEGHQKVALARLALSDDESGIDGALAAVPDSLRADPGLLYERLRWRRRKDSDPGALEILMSPPSELGRPALWWTERAILVRRLLAKRDFADAYRLASLHGQTSGPTQGEAEFLAGWLALRFLAKPAAAMDHFQRLYKGASTTMTK
ncbi:MAG: hypothetical protein ACOYMG_06945, partial [Candidatus Methylumidiphilus sp.]